MSVMKMDVPLVVVGKKTQYMNFLKIQMKKMNFDNEKIIFLKDVSIDELPIIYSLSSLFLYPSLFEGFGIPILEALNCKTPVISSKGGCFQEAGGDFSKYIDSENREEFAFQIEECLTNTELRESMINQGLKHAENFQPNKISKQLIDVYESLV